MKPLESSSDENKSITPFQIVLNFNNEDLYHGMLNILENYFQNVGIEGIIGGKTNTRNYSEKNLEEKITPNLRAHTLEDVIGLEKAKEELLFLVNYPTTKQLENILGFCPKKGVVLYGSPGVGKNYLYEAVVNEARLNGIRVGTTLMDFSSQGGIYVNSTIENITNSYKTATKRLDENKTDLEIIFMDEVDCMLSTRKGGPQKHIEDQKVVNALNMMIDGEYRHDNIYFICCTNFLDGVDPAILRPGRLTPVECTLPGKKELKKLFESYHDKLSSRASVELFDKLDSSELATFGKEKNFTGADVNNIFQSAISRVQREIIKKEYTVLDFPLITQDELLNLINNYDPSQKGEFSKNRKIGFGECEIGKTKTVQIAL